MTLTGFSLRFEFPGLTALNSAANLTPYRKTRLKKLILKEVRLATRGKLPIEPLEHAKVRITRASSGQPPDCDNLYHGAKMILDALGTRCDVRGVQRGVGVIKDDKHACIGMMQVRWRKTLPKKGYMLVEVFGCESEDLDLEPWRECGPWDGLD